MLCQNCKRNDASVHLKRIINGETGELHLCSSCASVFGAADSVFTAVPFSGIFSELGVSPAAGRHSNKTLRCDTCGFTFDDISNTGYPGCPDCYRVFSQKMRPMITKLHGRAVYKGRRLSGETVEKEEMKTPADETAVLRERLQRAVEEQNFELAAVLRDEILRLTSKEDK